MTIIDLIKKSAITLNIKQVLDDSSLDDFNYEDEETILSNNFELKRLFEFSKIVLNEIASYVPQVQQVTRTSQNKKILFNDIGDFAKIVSIKGKNSYVDYTFGGNAILFDEDDTYTIVFNQHPATYSLLATIDMRNGNIGEDLLVSGLNSYYCLATGLFAEYNVYNSSYVDRLARIKNLKLFAMPCRSWNG